MSRLARPTPSALAHFKVALGAFSADPSPENLRLYLAASRALEESRSDYAALPDDA